MLDPKMAPGTGPSQTYYDFVVAGGGIAGVCAAFHLSSHGTTLLLERSCLAAGASGAAAGLVNPLLSNKARPVWQADAAMKALHRLLADAGASHLFDGRPTLRPAHGAEQADTFCRAARENPDRASWHLSEDVHARFPLLHAPFGALRVHGGGAMRVPEFVRAVARAAQRRGAELLEGTSLSGFSQRAHELALTMKTPGTDLNLTCGRLVLALGDGWTDFPALRPFRLHNVKGQLARVRPPPAMHPSQLPHLSGAGYVAAEDETLVLGSTYEHSFSHSDPTAEGLSAIFEKIEPVLPGILEATLIEQMAGVRVSTRGSRLPVVSPLQAADRVWLFTGLGSKGLLLAPLLAHHLPPWISAPASVPPELQPRLR